VRFLLAVLACHHRAGHLQAIRDCWVPEILGRFEYRFFFGRGSHANPQADEITLDCDDAYRGLACKVQEVCRWTLHQGFEGLVKTDDDTAWIASRIAKAVNTDWAKHNWVGRRCGPTDMYHEHVYARGGVGYFLSRQSMAALAAAPKPNPDIPSEYAEDSWVGKVLGRAGIECVDDDRLRCADFSGPGRGPRPAGSMTWQRDCPTLGNNFISTCEFLGNEMYPVHELWVASCVKQRALMSKLRIR
jgi:hypothetical protein